MHASARVLSRVMISLRAAYRCLVAAVLLVGMAACQRIHERDFIGKWQSSRAVTPIYLAANGEWEIRRDDGTVLQYGVWRYADRQLVWSIQQGARILDDPTAVLAMTRDQFKLQERDGSTTVFQRLP